MEIPSLTVEEKKHQVQQSGKHKAAWPYKRAEADFITHIFLLHNNFSNSTSSYVLGNFHEPLNLSQLFLKLTRFIIDYVVLTSEKK